MDMDKRNAQTTPWIWAKESNSEAVSDEVSDIYWEKFLSGEIRICNAHDLGV